jgi:heat shock protein HtpX
MVEEHSGELGIEKPDLKIARMGVPNAFAVGRKGAGVVVVSEELLGLLDPDELEGVLAHELAHIANRDVVTMQLGQGIASIVAIVAQYAVLLTGDSDLADFFLAIVVGNLVQFFVMLFVLAISRYREYVADADAKRAIGSGDPLARALEKIHEGNQRTRESARSSRRGRGRGRDRGRRDGGVDQQVSALCISSPDRGLLQRIVSTHPPMEKRIRWLRPRCRARRRGPRRAADRARTVGVRRSEPSSSRRLRRRRRRSRPLGVGRPRSRRRLSVDFGVRRRPDVPLTGSSGARNARAVVGGNGSRPSSTGRARALD